MNTFYKFVALLLALTLCTGYLFSCNDSDADDESSQQNQPSSEDDGKKDAELQTDKYRINVRIAFATDDEDMKAAVRSVNGANTVIDVDKNNVSLITTADVNGFTVKKSYVYIGADAIYSCLSYRSADNQSAVIKRRADVTEENVSRILLDIGDGAGIGLSDFILHEISGTAENRYYSSSSITESAAESLCGIIESKFPGASTVTIQSATYKLQLLNGRNDSSVLSCSFVIFYEGVEYSLTMRLYCDYDYDAEFEISAPTDIDSYTEVSYLEIID